MMKGLGELMAKDGIVTKSAFKDEITRRITKRAADLGWTQVDISKELKAPKTTVNGWFSGVSMPNGLMLVQLCSVLRCNVDWLLSGHGSPVVTGASFSFDGLPGTWENENAVSSPYYRVPFYDSESHSLDQFNSKLFPSSFFDTSYDKKGLAWINCVGDSAKPYVSSGDVVFIDTLVKNVITSGVHYAFYYAGGIRIHKAFVNLDSTITLKDFTRESPDLTIQSSELQVVGLVRFRLGKV